LSDLETTTAGFSHAIAALDRGVARVWRAAVDLALPPRCPACGVIVTAESLSDVSLCPSCWQTLRFLGDPACARCSLPFETAQGEGALCGGCMADPPPYDGVHAAVAYAPVPRTLVLRFKYGRRVALAQLMARMMATRINAGRATHDDACGHDNRPLLVPVPLHRWRLWGRGFNQAAEITRWLAPLVNADYAVDALRRRRATPPLRGQGRAQRARTVRGAFDVPPRQRASVVGRRIILVDDVYTTGATVRSCARVLLRAGAASVEVATFARVIADAGDVDGQIVAIDTRLPSHNIEE
jgi:ComF family protein